MRKSKNEITNVNTEATEDYKGKDNEFEGSEETNRHVNGAFEDTATRLESREDKLSCDEEARTTSKVKLGGCEGRMGSNERLTGTREEHQSVIERRCQSGVQNFEGGTMVAWGCIDEVMITVAVGIVRSSRFVKPTKSVCCEGAMQDRRP